MKVLKEHKLFRCELDADIPVMIHRWLESPTSEQFKSELMNLLKIYTEQKKEFPNLKWLADTELLGELTEDTEDWLEEVWDKALFEEAGVKVHAVILGHDIYADYSMESFKRQADRAYEDKGVKLGIFMDRESALEWLKDA